MPTLFTAAHLKLSSLLAVLGILVALVFTIISGSSVVSLIARPIVSGLLMFLLGTFIYTLLAKKVPEAIDAMEHQGLETGEVNPALSDEAMHDGTAGDISENATAAGDGEMSPLDAYASSSEPRDSFASSIPRKTGVQIGKEEITVNGVKFKNQPEVMAETIKQLMDQDKD